ncbi:MAG: GWxTD domain-containing protein [Candidatus Kapabacteria bacterium]|nr:GWxTD domain-containing protein [Candidatus Kapabacteria bacterium]
MIRQRQSKQTESQPAADLTKGVFRLKSLGQLIARTSGVSAIPPVIASTRTASDNLYIDAQIPSSVLSPGAYVLVLTNQTTRDSAVLPFNIVWNDMPQSYRSMRVALDYMQYILSESEYDALRDGTDREARLNVETWWKKSDPTPQTAYNEKMVEFFRRCDYAKTTFSNFGTMDGVKTERGKIHVLFGFPTTITNAEDGKARTEVWRYENKVKQQFTFEISTNGVFKLAKVENI